MKITFFEQSDSALNTTYRSLFRKWL